MAESNDFRTAKRGFEPADVDRAFAQITGRITNAQVLRDEADKEIERLNRELNEARAAVKRANSKPTFSDLGVAFEQTLRVAEEQAAKLLQDASAEVALARESATADADRIQVSSERQAAKVLAEAQKRAEKIAEDSRRRSEDLVADAEAQFAAAKNALEGAAKAIDDIEKKANNDTRDVIEGAKLETEQARREMVTLRDLQARDETRIEKEIAAARAKAIRENKRLASETSTYIAEIMADSKVQVSDAETKGEQVVAEAEVLSSKTRQDAEQLRLRTLETSAGIIAKAHERANELNQQTQEYMKRVVAEAAMTVSNLDEARSRIMEFNGELSAMETGEDEELPVP